MLIPFRENRRWSGFCGLREATEATLSGNDNSVWKNVAASIPADSTFWGLRHFL
jgi:hypothetical protein